MKNQGADNDGYAISVKYDNGGVSALANWSCLADSNDSSVWNLGGAYSFGPAKISLGYEKTHDKGWKPGSVKSGKRSSQDNWILGLVYQLGAGRINASFSYMDIDHSSKWNGSKDIKNTRLDMSTNCRNGQPSTAWSPGRTLKTEWLPISIAAAVQTTVSQAFRSALPTNSELEKRFHLP